ncbi:hypothetical protein BKA62DRAFT_684399 [Auriculariales sp. MPI-PUGE-AT-0066]|nr:hypothetical protein BKA62DRAFT_684399 [Auriculariales sp. MPI-PUGE-AT-0066]
MATLSNRLFSRGSSPPPGGQQSLLGERQLSSQSLPAQMGSPGITSIGDQPQPPASTSDGVHIDALFRNIGAAQPNTASSSPMSHTSAVSSQLQTAADKQSALLSQLYGAPHPQGPPPEHRSPTPPPPQPYQLESPPASNNNAAGKILLDSLIGGNMPMQPVSSLSLVPSQQTQPQIEHRILQPHPSIPTPPNLTPDLEAGLDSPSPHMQQVQGSLPRQPSPRKSLFDFNSPFDALSAPSGPANLQTSSGSLRKKPVPPVDPVPTGQDEPSSPNLGSLQDPRRNKSVENLLEGLNNVAAPGSDAKPKPVQQPESPPPAQIPASREQRGPSPGPRGATTTGQWQQPPQQAQPQGKGSNGRKKQQTAQAATGIQAQNIVFDVSQQEGGTMASQDLVKSTAIALLKIDPIFVPGCTIGVTTWVAYAMTRGRVRVIGRANGERTLLQLPGAFPQTTTVIDMVVAGNRLAAVTSDGGFVIWEVPRIIEDDAPAQLLLCVAPTDEAPLKVVKWHPTQLNTLAVGSDTEIFLVNVEDAIQEFNGRAITQNELARVGSVYSVVSPLVSFAFDAANYTIMAVSEDSTLTCWSNHDKLPAFTAKIQGDGIPSSIDVIDGGVVIGRKQGTVLQLLPAYSSEVLSMVRFVNGTRDDQEMFGHVAYDHRIRTLWVANSRRESLIALRIALDPADPHAGFFDHLVEFPGLKPTIHFVVLSADTDPHGEEAEAACHAAKLEPGELALVAYSVHAHGVDQVLIRKEWFELALSTIPVRPSPMLSGVPQAITQPATNNPSPSSVDSNKPLTRVQQQAHLHHPQPIPLHHNPLAQIPARPRTPSSEDIDAEVTAAVDNRIATEVKARGPKGGKDKNKQKEPAPQQIADKEPAKVDPAPTAGSSAGAGSDVNAALTKEIRKVEDNLHTRIGRLISKELDKQQQRLEELRAAEQQADFARQEKILKLISTELTKNTTRVVEAAVKTVVQNSVLPSLETITKTEVKAALNSQIAKGLGESVNQTLPTEIERLLLRPDVANHVARTFSAAVTPLVERHVKDAINKTLIPAYVQQSQTMQQELSRELHAEILGVKKEIITWQTDALKGQETVIRDMESSIKTLAEQVKVLSSSLLSSIQQAALPPPPPPPQPQRRHSPPPAHPPTHSQQSSGHMRQAAGPPMHGSPMYAPAGFSQTPPSQAAPNYFPAPHPTLPQTAPPPPVPYNIPTQPAVKDEWDDVYMSVLGKNDLNALRDLLSRSDPEVIMPLNGHVPLSPAVVLTLIHRISTAIGEVSPVDEFWKNGMWWIQRALNVIDTNDQLISAYVPRVFSAVQSSLNTTRQRMSILPIISQTQEIRMISELQDAVARKTNHSAA